MSSRSFWAVYMVFAALLAAAVGIWQIAIGNTGAGVGVIVVAVVAAAACLIALRRSPPS